MLASLKQISPPPAPPPPKRYLLEVELDYADLVALTCVLRRVGGIGGARESFRKIGDAITVSLPSHVYTRLIADAVPLVNDADPFSRAIDFVSNSIVEAHFEKLKAL